MSFSSQEKTCPCPFCHNPVQRRKEIYLGVDFFYERWSGHREEVSLNLWAWENFILSNSSQETKHWVKKSLNGSPHHKFSPRYVPKTHGNLCPKGMPVSVENCRSTEFTMKDMHSTLDIKPFLSSSEWISTSLLSYGLVSSWISFNSKNIYSSISQSSQTL